MGSASPAGTLSMLGYTPDHSIASARNALAGSISTEA